MTKGPENPVKKAVREFLDSLGIWHFAPSMNGYGRSGIPDDIGCMPVVVTQAMVGKRIGLFVAIEAKADFKDGGKAPTKWQDKEIAAIRAAGGIAIVARGAGAVEAVREALKC